MSGVRFEFEGETWEVVGVRVPVKDEHILHLGDVITCGKGNKRMYTVVRKVEPKFREVEVSDWLVETDYGSTVITCNFVFVDSRWSTYTLIPGTTRTIRIPIEEGDEQE